MFGTLTEKFKSLTSRLLGQKKLSQENISEAVAQVREALLEADVNFTVVTQFMKRVQEKALGDKILKAVLPGEQFVKLVHEELVTLMGSKEVTPIYKGSLTVFMLCGLQGSGKTTTAAKLAHFLQKNPYQKKVLVAACDLQRAAAVEQLQTLCSSIGVTLFTIAGNDPVQIAKEALREAKQKQFDALIVDTAGRLHIDEELMNQLHRMKEVLEPQEILFVVSANSGQDAAVTAKAFDEKIPITGTILTMVDGSARAGAALSIREVTQKPLQFEGFGEGVAQLRPFNPQSMADRILGMGDVVNLVRLAKEQFDQTEADAVKKKLLKSQFTYDDYLKQMASMKRMGPLKNLLQMFPGASQMPNLDQSEGEFTKIEAMILSMNPAERHEQAELIPSRRWRIAKGSGTSIDDVNRLIKKFKQTKDLLKRNFPKNGPHADLLKKFQDFTKN